MTVRTPVVAVRILTVLLGASVGVSAAGAADAGGSPPSPDNAILSARFSHDDADVPEQRQDWAQCSSGSQIDAIVVVFAEQLDQKTLDAQDFTVHTQLGDRQTPRCAWVPLPDAEVGDRTVWLVGELGDAERNAPRRVEVTGALDTERGTQLRGAVIDDIDGLSTGPEPVLAERLSDPREHCPARARAQAVRVTWNGSISSEQERVASLSRESEVRTSEIQQALREGIVALVPRSGKRPRRVNADAIGELQDDPNMVTLCFAESANVERVLVSPAIVTGPQDDWNSSGRLDVVESAPSS